MPSVGSRRPRSKSNRTSPRSVDAILLPSEPIRRALLTRSLSTAAAKLQAGSKFALPTHIQLSLSQSTAIRDGLQAWLGTGDFGHLTRLLASEPSAIAYPGVVLILRRLRRLGLMREHEAFDGDVWLNDEPEPLPPGTCHAAEAILEQLAAAVVTSILGAGWIVQRQSVRGRPKRSLADVVEAHEVCAEYDSVLEHLRDGEREFKRRAREADSAWAARLQRLIQTAWGECGLGFTGISTPERTMPADVAERTAAKALELDAERRPILDHVAYALVGCKYDMSVRAVRHRVEVARGH